MRVYREYRCDEGHEWTVSTEERKAEAVSDTFCPEGHEAVTCSEQLPADEVQVLFRSAARIMDRAKGTIMHAGRYYLVLLDRADRALCASREHFTWDEAIQFAGLFRGKTSIAPWSGGDGSTAEQGRGPRSATPSWHAVGARAPGRAAALGMRCALADRGCCGEGGL
jgi:hypothetical protein